MARRSDHTREELKGMAITAGQEIIAQEGLGKFSARKVAKKIGYTVGTVYNVFGSHDALILHINAATLDDMGKFLTERLNSDLEGSLQIKHLASCYLEFVQTHRARWNALFEHNLPADIPLPDWYAEKIKELFSFVETPLHSVAGNKENAERAAKTLWAGIHGICALGLNGKLDVIGVESVQELMDEFIDHYCSGLSHCGE